MNLIPTYLNNFQAVIDAFGYWPSFHDGEIRSLIMDRNRILFDQVHNARIELTVHAWEMTGETSENGFLKLVKHHLVHFEFTEVREVLLKDFNHQNAVFGLLFEELPKDRAGNHLFKVTLEPAFGLNGTFIAYGGTVVSVIPCKEDGIV